MKIYKPDEPAKDEDEKKIVALRASGERHGRLLGPESDEKESLRLVEEHAGHDFDRVFGPETEVLQRELPQRDERASAVLEELRALEEKRRATQPYLIVSPGKRPGDKECSSFRWWTTQDQVTFCASLIFMVIVLSAGAGNVFSAIQAEAIPVFLENPVLAVLLSCLLPSGSVALHSFAEFLETDRRRHQYNKLIAALTFVFLTIWAFAFGLNFQIGDDTLYAAPLNESVDKTSVVFTIVQLMAELFCGTSLALIATHIHRRYTKDITIPNPESETLDRQIAQAKARYEPVQVRQRAWGRLAQLKAMRALHISERKAWFIAFRRRCEELKKMIS